MMMSVSQRLSNLHPQGQDGAALFFKERGMARRAVTADLVHTLELILTASKARPPQYGPATRGCQGLRSHVFNDSPSNTG